jgi:hypothetical protein
MFVFEIKLIYNVFFLKGMFVSRGGGGNTISVKFRIYMSLMTIFRGVLDNFLTYFLSPYYYKI